VHFDGYANTFFDFFIFIFVLKIAKIYAFFIKNAKKWHSVALYGTF